MGVGPLRTAKTRCTALLMVTASLCCTSAASWAAVELGQVRPLQNEGARTEKPAISPDGTKIAFVSDRGGAENIWVQALDGGPATQLTREKRPEVQCSTPRWSPKGDALVYSSNKGTTGGFDLWVVSADGQRDEPLTNDPGLDWMPAWSPNGKLIAFVSDRQGGDALWVINADGSQPRKIADLAYEPTWSPDSTRLAAYHIRAEGEGVYLFGLESTEAPRLVLPGGRQPNWSPDGRYLLAVKNLAGGGQLWLVDLQKDSDRSLGPIGDGIGWPTWGPNLIAYEARVGGAKQVMVATLTEGQPVVAILEPQPGGTVRGLVQIKARLGAEGGKPATWRLEAGQGASPKSWTLVAEGNGIVDGPLASWQTAGLEGLWTLRLTTVSDNGETTVSAVPVTVLGHYGVAWEKNDLPKAMHTNALTEVALSVRNTGLMTWRNDGPFAVYASYQWVDATGRVVVAEGLRTDLPKDVAAGETVALKARVVAPPTGGPYVLRFDLRQGGQLWFAEQGAQPLEAPINVTVPYAFKIEPLAPPTVMVPGQIYSLEVRLQNTGALTWHGQASAATADSDAVFVTCRWRNVEGGLVDAPTILTSLPGSVAPGESATLTARVQAPSVNGRYRLTFDLRDGKGLFSERMPSEPTAVTVTVASPYAVEFVGHNTPGRMFPSDLQAVSLQARNTGSARWRIDGPQPVRITYRWLDRRGRPISNTPLETELPYEVAPGNSASMTARLQAPGEPGEYTLVWDLVQTGGRRFSELGNLPLQVPVMVGAPTHSVKWEQIQHPIEMVVGALYTVELRLTNTGAMTWPANDGVRLGYKWIRANGEELAKPPIFTPVGQTVDPGQNVRIVARVQAPERAGRYMLRWDLFQQGQNFFSDKGSPTLDVPVAVDVIYGAQYLSHDTPNRLVPKQRYRVNLRIRNAGTIPWEAGGAVPVVLSYRWFSATGDEVTKGQAVRTPITRTVQPGDSIDIAAFIEAPATPGRYDLEWDLLFAGTVWFSEKGVTPLRVPVTVE